MDIVGALTDYTKFLKGEISASQSEYMNEIVSKFSYETDQRSFVLRLIVHYVGDLHQPEHSTALVDTKYPSGDRGGNSEKIPSKDGASNLHAVWDSVLYEYTGRPSLPLSDSDWTWYTSEASSLSSAYPIDSSAIKSGQFSVWAQEGQDMASEFVYPDFVEGQDPDQAYIDKAKPVLEEHMMLAANRLAALMVDIYGSSARADQFIYN